MTHVTYRLTAKNRDQLRDPTLGNRVWAIFTFLNLIRGRCPVGEGAVSYIGFSVYRQAVNTPRSP